MLDLEGPTKWISNWRDHGTLENIVGHHVSPTKKILNSRRSRIYFTITLLKYFDLGDSLLIVSALKLVLFSFVSLFSFYYTKRPGYPGVVGPGLCNTEKYFCIYFIVKLI